MRLNHIRDDLDVIQIVIARATDELERLIKENEELREKLSAAQHPRLHPRRLRATRRTEESPSCF